MLGGRAFIHHGVKPSRIFIFFTIRKLNLLNFRAWGQLRDPAGSPVARPHSPPLAHRGRVLGGTRCPRGCRCPQTPRVAGGARRGACGTQVVLIAASESPPKYASTHPAAGNRYREVVQKAGPFSGKKTGEKNWEKRGTWRRGAWPPDLRHWVRHQAGSRAERGACGSSDQECFPVER